jgi:hypothetical protein
LKHLRLPLKVRFLEETKKSEHLVNFENGMGFLLMLFELLGFTLLPELPHDTWSPETLRLSI